MDNAPIMSSRGVAGAFVHLLRFTSPQRPLRKLLDKVYSRFAFLVPESLYTCFEGPPGGEHLLADTAEASYPCSPDQSTSSLASPDPHSWRLGTDGSVIASELRMIQGVPPFPRNVGVN